MSGYILMNRICMSKIFPEYRWQLVSGVYHFVYKIQDMVINVYVTSLCYEPQNCRITLVKLLLSYFMQT